MAVTERFREIGTFKCLGALNSFVVRIFVLEAVYQGILGGISGSLAGVLFSTVSLLIKLGWPVLLWWPTGEMAIRILSVTGLAVILSLIGVVYPALVAAKMQPAVALRSEE
jgi:ABC-type antimicrobial peptide transport system permease subunit